MNFNELIELTYICDAHIHLAEVYKNKIEIPSYQKYSCISCAHSTQEFKIQQDLIKNSPSRIFSSFGIHPQFPLLENLFYLESLLEEKKLNAVGETGFDFYTEEFSRTKKQQTEAFLFQIELAQKYNLPVIIHNRDAGKDVFDILSQRIPDSGAILHCYSENAEYAKKCLDMNIYFSFAGNLTYRNARNLHETVLNIPLDRILIETESPFMIPSEFREKKRTMPEYLPSTAKFLSEILDINLEELTAQLWKNSCKVFKLPE